LSSSALNDSTSPLGTGLTIRGAKSPPGACTGRTFRCCPTPGPASCCGRSWGKLPRSRVQCPQRCVSDKGPQGRLSKPALWNPDHLPRSADGALVAARAALVVPEQMGRPGDGGRRSGRDLPSGRWRFRRLSVKGWLRCGPRARRLHFGVNVNHKGTNRRPADTFYLGEIGGLPYWVLISLVFILGRIDLPSWRAIGCSSIAGSSGGGRQAR
jgi:hypothetical protein